MTSETDRNFLTPVGRLVGGSLSQKRTKNYEGQVLPENERSYEVSIALSKTDPATDALIAKIKAVGQADWATDPIQLQKADFSWKIQDGDCTKVNKKGNINANKDGYPGNWVLTLSTRFEFQCCGPDSSVLMPASEIHRGFWIRLAGDIKGNGKPANPGVYLNLRGAQFIREDARIGGGMAAAADLFGGSAPAAPAAPAHDVVANALAGTPAAPVAPTPPAPPAGPQFTAAAVAAGFTTIEAAIAGGWTLETLKQNGHLA